MANLRIKGDVSGYVDLAAPDVAGSTTIDLSKLLVADSSGNVGIGTSSPGRLLTLFNNDQPVFQITNNTSGSSSTNGMIFYQASGSTNHNIDNQGSGSGGDIQFMAAGSNTLKIQANGNVGIGTTSPTFATIDTYSQRGIEISGTKESGTAPVIKLTETGSGKGAFEIRSNREGLTSGNYLAFGENTDTFMVIRGDDDGGGTSTRGNVGIGTTSPDQKLTISNGNLGIEHTTGYGIYIGPDAAEFSSFGSNASTIHIKGTDPSGGNVARAGAIRFQSGDGQDTTALYSTTGTDGYGTVLCSYAGDLKLSTGTLAGNKMVIKNGGNVGIGTNDPTDLLTINQGGATNYIRMEGPSSGDYAGGLLMYRGSTLRGSIYTNPTHNMTILSETGINFRSNGAERFRIDHAQANMVHVQGDTADHSGTGGGSKGFSLATAGGTSCPLYFGTETNSAQKSMYMNGYWIYLRGHQNEGIRFVFSQGGGTAIRSDQYQFKYNSAYRPTGNTTWDGFSDARAKENVTNLTGALDTISQLRPVTFDWTDDYADTMNMFEMDTTDEKSYNHFSVKENGYDLDRKTSQIGFIAQEFEEVFPKSITETEMQLGDTKVEDFKTVNYDHLIPVLTKAVQELKAENDALKARIEALEGQ